MGRQDEKIGDLMQRLGIEEEEYDDLVFEDDEMAPKQGMKWLALVKVHTSNPFSHMTFEKPPWLYCLSLSRGVSNPAATNSIESLPT